MFTLGNINFTIGPNTDITHHHAPNAFLNGYTVSDNTNVSAIKIVKYSPPFVFIKLDNTTNDNI